MQKNFNVISKYCIVLVRYGTYMHKIETTKCQTSMAYEASLFFLSWVWVVFSKQRKITKTTFHIARKGLQRTEDRHIFVV